MAPAHRGIAPRSVVGVRADCEYLGSASRSTKKCSAAHGCQWRHLGREIWRRKRQAQRQRATERSRGLERERERETEREREREQKYANQAVRDTNQEGRATKKFWDCQDVQKPGNARHHDVRDIRKYEIPEHARYLKLRDTKKYAIPACVRHQEV